MLEVVQTYAHAWAAEIQSFLTFIGVLPEESGTKTDTLGAAVILAVLTAVISVFGYLGKLLLQGLSRLLEERKKYTASLVRYVYDVDIWKNDFAKNFSPENFDRSIEKLINGGDKFKFSIGSSKEEDAKDIMTYIHWLRPAEIYTIRLFIAYSELFDGGSMMISSSDFADFDPKRKLDVFVKVQDIGLDTYNYADRSLEELRRPVSALAVALLLAILNGALRCFSTTERLHLHSPIYGKIQKAHGPVLIEEDGNRFPPGWETGKLDALHKAAKLKLDAVLEKRGERLGHYGFPDFFSFFNR